MKAFKIKLDAHISEKHMPPVKTWQHKHLRVTNLIAHQEASLDPFFKYDKSNINKPGKSFSPN